MQAVMRRPSFYCRRHSAPRVGGQGRTHAGRRALAAAGWQTPWPSSLPVYGTATKLSPRYSCRTPRPRAAVWPSPPRAWRPVRTRLGSMQPAGRRSRGARWKVIRLPDLLPTVATSGLSLPLRIEALGLGGNLAKWTGRLVPPLPTVGDGPPPTGPGGRMAKVAFIFRCCLIFVFIFLPGSPPKVHEGPRSTAWATLLRPAGCGGPRPPTVHFPHPERSTTSLYFGQAKGH